MATTLLLLLGIVSIFKMQELSETTQKIYKHPFAVANATKTIEANLISMHRYMKDVVLALDENDINNAVNRVNESEREIYKQFSIVFERYLGKKEDIQQSYDSFVSWKPVRDEVIDLMQHEEFEKAKSINKGKAAVHVESLMLKVDTMIEFANNKAIYFRENAIKSENNAISFIVILLVSIVFGNMTMLYFLLKDMDKNNKQIKEHFHLIDQNIMSAKVNTEYKVTAMSNALARHLGMGKEELLEQEGCSLLNDTSQETINKIKRVVESGEEYRGEIIKFDVNKEEKWFELHMSPVFDADYNILEYTNILHDISARKEMEAISNTDSLTNLYNRRFFDTMFPKEIKIAQREKHCLVFCMVDIDFFKQYNDTYGHQAGDVTLKKVAKVLKYVMQRPDDYSFRLGGEEFGLLFKVDNEKSALNMANKVKDGVESLKIDHSQNSASQYITISIGVYIVANDEHASMDEVYSKCDGALYEAKKAGRNQIKLA